MTETFEHQRSPTKAVVVGKGHLAVGQEPSNREQLIWQRETLSLFLQESVRESAHIIRWNGFYILHE